MKSAIVVLAAAASLILTACGGSAEPAARASSAPSCPAAWQPGWAKLARQIDAPVYCPGWMPNVNFHRWPTTRMPHCRAETSKRQIPC